MNTNPDDHGTAEVSIPPPLLFLVALGLSFALQYFLPLPISRLAAAVYALRIAGIAVAVAALALAVSAIVSFRAARSSPMLMRPATALVLRGPYRFTRNPVYLALALLHAAVGLFFNVVWVLLFLVPAVLGIRYLVIAREEKYLLRRFGAEYEAYCRSVRRWV